MLVFRLSRLTSKLEEFMAASGRSKSATGAQSALSALIVVFVLAACGGESPATTPTPDAETSPDAGTAEPGDAATDQTLVYGLSTDPQGGCDGTQIVVINPGGNCPLLVQEPLVVWDEETNSVQPGLATSWEEEEDAVTFTLREDVMFHDGTPFDADAVVYNVRRVWDESFEAHAGGTYPYAAFVPVESVEKIDDMTVTVQFTGPTPLGLVWLTTWPAMIQSPTAVEAHGEDYTFNAVGTGPYELVSYEDATRIEMRRNDDYWGSAPRAETIVMIIKSDASALANDLLAGAIDVLLAPAVEMQDQMEAAGFEFEQYPTLTIFGGYLNTLNAPTDDVRVRQAINHAFDKESVAELARGAVAPHYAAWIPDQYAFNPDVPRYEYDPERAGELLDEAGWVLSPGETIRQRDGENLKVIVAGRTGYSGLQAVYPPVLVSNLQDVGFEVETVTIEQAVYFESLEDTESFNIGLSGRGSLIADPSSLLQAWHTDNLPPNELNFNYYSNPDYDALLDAAASELDPEERERQLMEAQQILREDAPYLWGIVAQTVVAFNPDKIVTAPYRVFGQFDMLNVQFRE